MDVHILGWIGLAAIILTLIVIDIVGHVRTPHEPTMKEAAVWSVAYIGMALAFGGIVWFVWGGGFAQEYLAGYITEKALSIDNLFVFVIMMSSFKVPRKYQQEVLLAGIVIALILRLIFILAGAAQGDLAELINELTQQMHAAAEDLHFELAARLRDEIQDLKKELRAMRAAD